MKYSADLPREGAVKNNTPQGVERYYEIPAYGFTLAEVLITLGIIGVVAAMTIPTLISNYQDKVLETRYKKAKNILINGYKLMMAKDQVFDVAQLPFMKQFDDANAVAAAYKEVFKITADSLGQVDPDKLPKDYKIQDNDDPSPFNWSEVPYVFHVSDGMLYGVQQSDELKNFYVYADLNGSANPNTVKKDLYKFQVSGNASVSDVSGQLEEVSSCTWEDPSGCKTQEECKAAADSAPSPSNTYGGCFGKGIIWSDNRCYINNETGGACYDIGCYNMYCR